MTRKKRSILIVTSCLCVVAALAVAFWPAKTASVDDTEDTEETEKVAPVGPAFNADSAYAYTKAQCDFGPRDMNSKGHDACGEWIVAQFERLGCKVTRQKADLKGYDGTILHSMNIMASYNPAATTRIMLCAHWDSRPWADNDPDSTNWHKPILAANDAASGVAVMLELARLLAQKSVAAKLPQNLGVDFVCFDAEDWGTPQWSDKQDDGSSWALGAQYFSYAPEIVKKVWRAARQAGFGSFFPKSDGGMITDDHIPVNQTAKIPCIDIIPYYPNCQQSSFGPTWHTLADDMEHIDKNTLKAVGQTLVQVIFCEK